MSNKKSRFVTEQVQQEDTERRADVEEKKALAEEKARRKQRKKIVKPPNAKAALYRMLKSDVGEEPQQPGPRPGKSYRENVLKDKIKYRVTNVKKPKPITKRKIKTELAKETAKKISKKALLKSIPVVGAIASLLESSPAYKKGGKVSRKKYAYGGRVAKYKG